MSAPRYIAEAVDAGTRWAIQHGPRILQGNRLGSTDEAHVSVLLDRMRPFGTILDVGCGFGEVSRLMKQERPALDFVLLNRNELQLSHAPDQFCRVLSDMHAMPVPTASVDGVMFCYSLCHADPCIALTEAARVTRRGGGLFVYDYDRLDGDNRLMEARLCARALRPVEMVSIAGACGWAVTDHENTGGDDSLFRELYANDAEYDAIFSELAPATWRMVRC